MPTRIALYSVSAPIREELAATEGGHAPLFFDGPPLYGFVKLSVAKAAFEVLQAPVSGRRCPGAYSCYRSSGPQKFKFF
jgi:hypothetical protein